MRTIHVCVASLVLPILLGGVSLVRAAEPVVEWTLTDHLKHDWKRELVLFPLPKGFATEKARQYRLVDEKGTKIPWQPTVRQGKPMAGFIVDLPAGATRTFRLVDADTKPRETDLNAMREGKTCILGTSRGAIRLPLADGFKPGTPFDQLPPPILGIWTHSGKWVGSASLTGKMPVRQFESRVVERGPVWIDYRVRYEFGDRKFYQLDFRAIAGGNAVLVDETFRLSQAEFDEAPFARGPNCAPPLGGKSTMKEWQVYPGYMGRHDVVYDFDKYPTFNFSPMKGWAEKAWLLQATAPLKPEEFTPKDYYLGVMLAPFQAIGGHGKTRAIGFYTPGGPDVVGLFYRNLSKWEHPAMTPVPFEWKDGGAVARFVAFEGHREWGIVTGPNRGSRNFSRMTRGRVGEVTLLERAIVKHGEAPLDTIKDWVLVWDDPADTPPHPRVFATPERLAAMRKAHGTDPRYRSFFDAARQKQLFDQSVRRVEWIVASFLQRGQSTRNTTIHGCQATMFPTMLNLDLGLACPDLTEAERRWARTLAAFYAYKQSSPDYWPVNEYANGPSNPNMVDINAAALAHTIGVVRGHPQWRKWAELTNRVEQASYRASASPDGVWFESPGYQWAGHRAANMAVLALERLGVLDPASIPRIAKVNTYMAHMLSPPDPRFRGVRPGVKLPEGMKIPNFSEDFTKEFGLTEEQLKRYSVKLRMPAALGDNMPFYWAMGAWVAGSVKQKYPTEAGHGIWAWRQMGRPARFPDVNRTVIDETVKPIPIQGTTKYFPGFGVMFRHGFGRADETFMTFRWTDHAYGHYDEDFGSFSMYAKGVPLCLDWMYYSFHGSQYHNTLSPGGQCWGETKLKEFTSTPGADYARGRQHIRVDAPEKGDWQRQIVLVKDEKDPGDKTYFVFRDSFFGKEKHTCNIWTMAAEPPRFEGGNVAHLKGQFGVDAHIMFFAKPPAPLTTRRAVHKKRVYGYDMHQVQHNVRASADSAAQYGYVIYPTKVGQMPPTVSANAEGVVQLKFADGTVHLIFLFPEPKSAVSGKVRFKGRCGIVKGTDRTALAGSFPE